jgi:hypothetical protein
LGELLPVGLYAEPVARLFLLENQIMNALNKQVSIQLTTTAQHIAISKKLRADMDKTIPLYNKATPEQQLAIRVRFAELIGKENGIKPFINNRGDVGFDRKTKKGDAARNMLRYYFPSKFVSAKPTKPTVSKQVDVVEALLAKVYALPKADRARFIALIKKDSK